MHLWETDHPYYCEGHCYFANYYQHDSPSKLESWDDFLSEMGEADTDYNLLFRWDWEVEKEDNEGEPLAAPRDVVVLTYFMQRKGYQYQYRVNVDREDERRVRDFLIEKWEHMHNLWYGISNLGLVGPPA